MTNLVLYFVTAGLQVGDVLTTAMFAAGPEMEGNTVMRVLWERLGFWALPALKAVVILAWIAFDRLLLKQSQFLEMFWRVGLWAANVGMLVVVLRNLWLLKRY